MRSDEANIIEGHYDELESKIKQESESAVIAQNPNEIETSGHNLGEDANVAAAHNVEDDANVVAHNLDEDTNAAEVKERTKKKRRHAEIVKQQKWKDQRRRRWNQKSHWRKKKHYERRQTSTERSEQEDQKVH